MSTFVAVFALVLAYAALVTAWLALRTLARLRRATALLSRGGEGRESIVEATERHIRLASHAAEQMGSLRTDVDRATAVLDAVQAEARRHEDYRLAATEQLTTLRADAERSLRNVALVRYDAFDDMAGRISFSLALLDDRGDGVALTAISGRTDTRLYAKGIVAGKGEHDLSPEEHEAVAAALRQQTGRRNGRHLSRRKAG
jgi:Protein of unknown function (DUF4446)